MDESAKQIFKMKFAKLTMVLNGIFLIAALAILAAFGVIPIYSYPIAAICGAGAILLALYFRTAYKRDKEWLQAQDDETGTGKESGTASDAGDAGNAGDAAGAANTASATEGGIPEGERDA